jgi:hypothetical protein
MGTIKINPNNRIDPILNNIDYAIEEINFKIDKYGCEVISDHAFNLASWIVPYGSEGKWVFHGEDYSFPEVYAWMPLPKHFQPQEIFSQDDDLMEHAMFEDDPEWLYKGKYTYEQMSMEDFMKG